MRVARWPRTSGRSRPRSSRRAPLRPRRSSSPPTLKWWNARVRRDATTSKRVRFPHAEQRKRVLMPRRRRGPADGGWPRDPPALDEELHQQRGDDRPHQRDDAQPHVPAGAGAHEDVEQVVLLDEAELVGRPRGRARTPSGTATIQASSRQYQWTFERFAGRRRGAGGDRRAATRRRRSAARSVGVARRRGGRDGGRHRGRGADRRVARAAVVGRRVPVRRGGGATGAGAPVRVAVPRHAAAAAARRAASSPRPAP